MPNSYIITLKKDASEDDVKALKEEVKSSGGSVDHEYTLIKAFSCTFPDGHVSTLENHPHVDSMEKDQEVKTQ